MFKLLLRSLLKSLFKVEVKGEENLNNLDERLLIVANHTSFLDAALLYAFLPGSLLFAINSYVAQTKIGQIASRIVQVFPIDPANPLSIRSLIRRLQKGGRVVIFPEGRITVTGALMKIYQGPGLVADKAKAKVLPIHIEGAQLSLFSRLADRMRLKLLPKIILTIQPSKTLQINEQLRGRKRRIEAGKQLAELMINTQYEAAKKDQTLLQSLLQARKIYGGKHIIAEDIQRQPINYDQLLCRSLILGNALKPYLLQDKCVGVLLPGTLACAITFWGLHTQNKIPAMLNYTVGSANMKTACETACLKTIISSRSFIQKAKLENIAEMLESQFIVIYLEDVAEKISTKDKLSGLIRSRFDSQILNKSELDCEQPAVILYTSGSEGTPKGVVLSHRNLNSNIQQLSARVDFNPKDVALNALPLFHSFGLTAGMLLPMLSGIKVFFYPSPLHYRVVPEIAYDINATLLFGTNTFLSGYARFADAYDFYSIRYVFAGAEKLQDEIRAQWHEKFGVRIFEGYGATESSPVIAGNSPKFNRAGTVGQLMPGMQYQLQSVPGLQQGKRLFVNGPNIMMGYLFHDNPGVLVPPVSEFGEGWYDTGDIVTIDAEGFITICGRVKRFAKIAGEMVSLTSVEELASKCWPDAIHAAVSIPDSRKGEQIILLTNSNIADRSELLQYARQHGFADIAVPRKVMPVKMIPVLGTGKIDYVSANKLLAA